MTKATQTHNQLSLGPYLGQLAREVIACWREIQRWPLFAWLVPAVRVRLLAADGQESTCLVEAASIRSEAQGKLKALFTAVELPESLLLLRRISLPALSAAELSQAVALDVAGASPFQPGDVVWGYSTRPLKPGMVEANVALASRHQVENYLRSISSEWQAGGQAEVWAIPATLPAIVFTGFGEKHRIAHAASRQHLAFALLLAALGLLTAIASTPVAQLRLRAVEAVHAFDALSIRVTPLVRQRATLARTVDTAAALRDILAQRSDPLDVFDLLTKALPDDTSLLSVQVQGSKVSIAGATANAAALMQQLSARPEFRDVKAPAAATRPLGTTRDSFNIDLSVAGRAAPGTTAGFPAAGAQPAIAPAAAAGATPQPVANAPATVSATVPTSTVAPAAAPPAQAARPTGGATFGGATFGAATAPAQTASAPRTTP